MIDKAFLKQHYEMVREYQQEVQRLEQYDDSVIMPSPSNMDGMPHVIGNHSDNTSLWVVRKTLMEENIAELRKILSEDEVRIESIVKKLSKANEKTVIRLRYINCLSWDEIVFFCMEIRLIIAIK